MAALLGTCAGFVAGFVVAVLIGLRSVIADQHRWERGP